VPSSLQKARKFSSNSEVHEPPDQLDLTIQGLSFAATAMAKLDAA